MFTLSASVIIISHLRLITTLQLACVVSLFPSSSSPPHNLHIQRATLA